MCPEASEGGLACERGDLRLVVSGVLGACVRFYSLTDESRRALPESPRGTCALALSQGEILPRKAFALCIHKPSHGLPLALHQEQVSLPQTAPMAPAAPMGGQPPAPGPTLTGSMAAKKLQMPGVGSPRLLHIEKLSFLSFFF